MGCSCSLWILFCIGFNKDTTSTWVSTLSFKNVVVESTDPRVSGFSQKPVERMAKVSGFP
jgi:hypothetical protein